MKKLILLLVYFYLLIISNRFVNAQWIKMNGLDQKNINSIVVYGDYMLAGTIDFGIYKSTDKGLNWTQFGLLNKSVYSLYIYKNKIFAGTETGVCFSSNNGQNWIYGSGNIESINSLSGNDSTIFAGFINTHYGIGGIYKSSNNGLNWTIYENFYHIVWTLTKLDSYIFAGTEGRGVYLTTNNGINWNRTNLQDYYYVHALTTYGQNIYAGTSDSNRGVYYSTNAGQNWIKTSLNNFNITSLAVEGTMIFAGSLGGGVFFSSNNGINWTQKNQGFDSQLYIGELFITNEYLYACLSWNSIWRRSLTEIIGINKISEEIPKSFSLHQNYPNPFNPSTNIKYQITKNVFITLKIFDAIGREVETVVNEKQSPGTYEVTFDGSNLPSGIYFYRLETENFSDVKKMVLIK